MLEVEKYVNSINKVLNGGQGSISRNNRDAVDGRRTAGITAVVLIISLAFFLLLTISLMVYGPDYKILTAPIGSRYHPRVSPGHRLPHHSSWP